MKDNRIMKAMEKVDDKYINEAMNYRPKRKAIFAGISTLAAIAACVLLVVGIGQLSKIDSGNPTKPITTTVTPEVIDSVVCIDINPSIELNVSKSNRVISANPLNQDATVVLGSMDLTNVELETALNAIIGALFKHGYLDEAYNSINVCIENDNEKRANELGAKVSGEIRSFFDKQDLIGNVSTQSCPVDSEIKALAKEYGISVGKLLLVRAVAANMNMDAEVLAEYSIAELWDLMDAEPTDLIIKEEALAIALVDAKVSFNDIELISNKIRVTGGVYSYVIKFMVGENEKYTYEIDARNGDVLKQEYEIVTEFEDDVEPDTEVDKEVETEEETETETETETVAPIIPETYISGKEAFKIAYTDAGVLEEEVKLEEFKHRKKEREYLFKFTVGLCDYEYLISEADGRIIHKEIFDKSVDESVKDEEIIFLTVDEVLSLALEKAGVELSQLTKYDIKYKAKKDKAEYTVHFHVDKTHYEYIVDAATGEITEKTNPTPAPKPEAPTPEPKPEAPTPAPKPEAPTPAPKPHEVAGAVAKGPKAENKLLTSLN